MKVKIVRNFRLLARGYNAITLYPFICFAPGTLITPRLLRHEMQHVRQVRRDGFFRFYLVYLFRYFQGLVKYRSHGLAYWHIPYEVEARRNEQKSFTRAEVAELKDQVEVDISKY